MNDYWNDPPEYPEPPECCGDLMDINEDGSCVCQSCGNKIEPEPNDYEIPQKMLEDIDVEDLLIGKECPHGKTDNCDHCDYLADIAYDSYRENKTR